MAPKLFQQLYVIRASVGHSAVTCMMHLRVSYRYTLSINTVHIMSHEAMVVKSVKRNCTVDMLESSSK